MQLRGIFIMALIAALAFASPTGAHDTVWPGDKLQHLMPEAVSFEQRNLYLSLVQQEHIEQRLQRSLPPEDLKPSLYLAVTRDSPDSVPKRTAAIVFIDVQGPQGRIELGVVVNSSGALLKVDIFDRKPTDVPIPPAFLGNLEGLRNDQALPPWDRSNFTRTEQQTLEAVAAGARRGLVLINEIFRR